MSARRSAWLSTIVLEGERADPALPCHTKQRRPQGIANLTDAIHPFAPAAARLAGLLNERELKSLAWAVRRSGEFGDGYAQNVRSAERALAKIREAAASNPKAH